MKHPVDTAGKRSLASLADGGLSGEEVIMTQQMKIMAALDAAANELAAAPPVAWAGWIAYFLEELELADDGTAVATGDYDDMLNEISATIAHRIARGGW